MAQNAKTEAAVRDRHERRTPVHLCRTLGKLERSRIWLVAAHLHDYHRRADLEAQIHPRMPVILPEQHHAVWLGETDDEN